MSLVRIANVTARDGKRLRLGLTDGTTIEREVEPLLNGPVFKGIREKPELFAQAKVEGGRCDAVADCRRREGGRDTGRWFGLYLAC